MSDFMYREGADYNTGWLLNRVVLKRSFRAFLPNIKCFGKFEVSGVTAVNPGIQIFQMSGVIAVKMSVL